LGVPDEDRVKGYKTADGSHVLLELEERDDDALESTHTVEIDSFVPRKEVDEIYLDNPPEKPSNVINLMDAFRRSVRSERGATADKSSRRNGKNGGQRAAATGCKRAGGKTKRLKHAS
jgi:non-homologous end joining protein Ku